MEYSKKLSNEELDFFNSSTKKNEAELMCNDKLKYIQSDIEIQLLRLDILKYLVSPSVIIALISIIFENYLKQTTVNTISILSLFVSIGIIYFLWNTFKNIQEKKIEETIYKTTLYRIKNSITYSDEEQKNMQLKAYSYYSKKNNW